jgi:hypothetical protein
MGPAGRPSGVVAQCLSCASDPGEGSLCSGARDIAPSTSDERVSGRVTSNDARRDAAYCSVLHRNPVVLFAPEWEILNQASAVWSILDAMPERVTYLVVGPSWYVDERRGAVLAARIRRLTQRFSHVIIAASCATPGEAAALQRQGLTAFHCSASALVREDFFTPSPVRHRRFDAIYDARWTDYKRHPLARSVRSLALIAAPSVEPAKRTLGYSLRARVAVRNATWISSPWGLTKKRWLSHEEINAAYNQARVGLCLSRVEGVMFASIQYLLAGLPVVTSRSLGGRDEFFSSPHVRWVDDDPHAVSSAVDELVALDLDPHAIRETTLAKVGQHRSRMQAWIQDVILAEGGELGRWGGDWPAGLANKLSEPKVLALDVLAEINETDRQSLA